MDLADVCQTLVNDRDSDQPTNHRYLHAEDTEGYYAQDNKSSQFKQMLRAKCKKGAQSLTFYLREAMHP